MKKEKNHLAFIGAQLDLARQLETVDYVKSFVDFISAHGYNTLVLYMEGRIRTRSFPFMGKGESYSLDEAREIVDYADKKKIEVVPVVAALGHAKQFLKHPELEQLAELRGGIEGRFSRFNKQMFCPSKKETLEFLEAYLTEVSALFPSKYFHAGFDESWDMGLCELCKARLERETQADIFASHMTACHRIISGKLRKKMMVWDDMFGFYPSALEKIPKDIILCPWHYEKLVEKPSWGCLGVRTDKLALYDKLGFKYVFSPVARSFRNVETFSAYAMARQPIGALLTSWEHMCRRAV